MIQLGYKQAQKFESNILFAQSAALRRDIIYNSRLEEGMSDSLLKPGLLRRTVSNKPRSRFQKYVRR